jgi:hypothetical protein
METLIREEVETLVSGKGEKWNAKTLERENA